MSLAGYVRALIDAVQAAEPDSATRLRQIVRGQVALISVDDEAIIVRFEGDELIADAATEASSFDGSGETDRQTVLALLAGRLEVTDAIIDGRLRMRGTTDGIVRISRAIEILIDVAVRAPRLQEIARTYRLGRGHVPLVPGRDADPSPPRALPRDAELAMLRRLGLLPD